MENITITCEENMKDYICSFSPFFSAGEVVISFLLLILVIFGVIYFIIESIKPVSVHKKYLGVNELEGKEIYHL